MNWFLLWAILLVWAVIVLSVIGRMLYRRGRALLAEIADAGDRLARAADQGREASWAKQEPELAVFADPAELRRGQRERARRARHRAPDRAFRPPSAARRLSGT